MTPLQALRSKKPVLLLLAVTQFMIIIDASIINVALPTIGTHLRVPRAALPWIVNAYTLTFGGGLLLGGRLADLLDRKRVLICGLALFSAASLAGAEAQSEAWLIAARAIQGIGAALVSPAAMSILTTTFAEGAERNRALGVWAAVAGVGGAAGVLLGGVLTSGLGWRSVLLVNVPVGAVLVALALQILSDGRPQERPGSFDFAGAGTITAGVALFVYALFNAPSVSSRQTLALLAGSAALLTSFVLIERRSRHPLVPSSIFKLRTVRGANCVSVLVGMSLISMFFFISLYMQQVRGYSALTTGVAYLPLALTIVVFAGGVASQLVTRIGFKPTLIIGLLVTAVGLLGFSDVHAPGGSYLHDLLWPSLVSGAGLGLSFVPVTIAAMAGTGPDEAGLASGMVNTSQQLGGAIGLAILAAIATPTLVHTRRGVSLAVTLTRGFDRAFVVGAGFALAGALLASFVLSTRDSREHSAAARADQAMEPANA